MQPYGTTTSQYAIGNNEALDLKEPTYVEIVRKEKNVKVTLSREPSPTTVIAQRYLGPAVNPAGWPKLSK
jgi:hypothetical protein